MRIKVQPEREPVARTFPIAHLLGGALHLIARAPAKAKAAGKAVAAAAARPLKRKVAPPAPAKDTRADRAAEKRAERAGYAAGIDQARERTEAIMMSDAGRANPAVARHLAFETSAPTDEALVILAAVGPAPVRLTLGERMAMRSDPRPGADAGPEPSGRPPTLAERIKAATRKCGLD